MSMMPKPGSLPKSTARPTTASIMWKIWKRQNYVNLFSYKKLRSDYRLSFIIKIDNEKVKEVALRFESEMLKMLFLL